MKWSFLVLDFDQIYDLEPEEEKGVEPEVFLISDDDLFLAKTCVQNSLTIIVWMNVHLRKYLQICFVRRRFVIIISDLLI